MSINSSGEGGRPGRTNPWVKAHGKVRKWHQESYDKHKYDGTDPDNPEAMPV